MKNRKKEGLYAVGHSLVDITLRVGNETIDSLELAPGSMTQVSRNKIDSLLLNSTPDPVAAGSVTRTIQLFASLGGSVSYLTAFSSDTNGSSIYNSLTNTGVAVHCPPDIEGDTGICLVLVDPSGEKTMLTARGIASEIDAKAVCESTIAESQFAYLSAFMLSDPHSGEAICNKVLELCTNHSTEFCFALGTDSIIKRFRLDVSRLVARSAWVFGNEREALVATSCSSVEEAAEEFSKQGVKSVITAGAKGVHIHNLEKAIWIPVEATKVVDATGAGDAFAGAFLYGLSENLDPFNAGEKAQRFSRAVVREVGFNILDDAVTIWNSG